MNVREIIQKLLPKKTKDEEPVIPLNWANQDKNDGLIELETEPVVESSWPNAVVKKGKRFVLGERKIKIAKGMFVFYFVLSLWSIRVSPFVLIFFVPTVLLIWDYIRCQETLKKLGAWAKEETS